MRINCRNHTHVLSIEWMGLNGCLSNSLTSSLRLETSNTFDIPLRDVGFVWPMPWVVANANAPRLGIALPYAPVVNGVPKPKANGGITLGAPRPFTAINGNVQNGCSLVKLH